jgi:hypothetical protein
MGQLRYFALATLLCALGFAVTLNLLNVDRFIVRQNLTRAASGVELDSPYLNNLSTDALPLLVEEYRKSAPREDIHSELKWVLSCLYAQGDLGAASAPWQSYHWSKANAQKLLTGLYQAGELSTASQDEYGRWTVPLV